jgi:biopolymer transport protein ExbB/TolQ
MTDSGFLGWLAGSGGDWVIYLLYAASIAVVAFIVERGIVLRREKKALDVFKAAAEPSLAAGDVVGFLKAARDASEGPGSSACARVLSTGIERPEAPFDAVEERLAARRILEKKDLEKRLMTLGTLGNNAPFIGLFGTVLGVIKAFSDLAGQSDAGPEVVMKGLSEALIATAVGLLVAIPAVIGYNFFQKAADDLLSEGDAMGRRLVAVLKERRGGRG